MHTANTIVMYGDLDRIVQLAADVERWPEILPHYRWVTLLEGGGDHKVVEMAARRGRIPVKWRAIQDIDRSGTPPVIRFRHIWGVTKGMEVDWTFDQQPDYVNVTIRHDFKPPWPVVGGLVAERVIGPQFISYIAGQTLATIKQIVEEERAAVG
jgi:ribosome-associated toxin RatA of RatAB toxin-antitoxin module